MKVALVLTGYMRNWKVHFPYIKENIIEKYNPDIFITSYSYSQEHWRSEFINVDVKEVINTYKPKNYIFRDEETCPEFNFKENGREKNEREWSIRQLKGWYTNYLALSLFNLDDYDVIIKSRTDLGVKNFNIDISKELVIPAWKVHPGPCEPNESYIDYFAYGNSECMKKYFELHSKMQELYNKDLTDISIGELLIYDYIEHHIGHEKVTLDYTMDWLLREAKMWATEQQAWYAEFNPRFSLKFPPL